MRSARILLVAGVVLAACGSDGGDGEGDPLRTTRAKLTLERGMQAETGVPELLVSLPGPQFNTAEITGGARSVRLRCVDRGGAATIEARRAWPLVEEYGYPPHIHQPAAAKVLDGIRACRLLGRGIDFRGRVEGRLPAAR